MWTERFRLPVPSTVLVFPPPGRCWWSFPSYCPGLHFPEPAYGSARTDKRSVLSFKLETVKAWKSSTECFQFNKPTLRFINQASVGTPRRKIRREFWQAHCPEVFPPCSFSKKSLLNVFTFIMAAIYRLTLACGLDPYWVGRTQNYNITLRYLYWDKWECWVVFEQQHTYRHFTPDNKPVKLHSSFTHDTSTEGEV